MHSKKDKNIFQMISCFYVACILTAITQSAHLMDIIIPFTKIHIIFSGGTLIIPIAFFIQNITTENYGFSKSMYLVKLSLIITFFSVAYQYIITFIPVSNNMIFVQNGYVSVFSAIPVHLIAFIFSVFIGLFVNDFIISKTKVYFSGKYLYTRFMFSTVIGEAIYIFIAFVVWSPYIDFNTQCVFLIFSYFYRLIFEAATLPISNFLVDFIKKHDYADVYDVNIKYSFLSFFLEKFKRK